MELVLLVMALKQGKFSEYEAFIAQIKGPKKKEYMDLLNRYGIVVTTVWYRKIGNKEYAVVFHKYKEDPQIHLKKWIASAHPFDVWFKDQLNKFYDGAPADGHLMCSFETA